MLKRKLPALALVLALTVSQAALANEIPLPEGAKQAEKAKQWDKALGIYDKALSADPAHPDWWVHVADIHAVRNEPKQAEDATEKALAYRPDDRTLLLKHAQLASWAGDNSGAAKSYREVLRQSPNDDDSRYALGNVLSWDARTGAAIKEVEIYIAHRPHDKKALLFLSQLYMWDGQSQKAGETLERYRQIAGEDKAYREMSVHMLANGGRNYAAITAADAALQSLPQDCDIYTTKSWAYSGLRQPNALFDSLESAGNYCPDKAGTIDLQKQLLTPYRSSLGAQYDYSTDSDTVRIWAATATGRLRIDPETYLTAGAETGALKASLTSGFQSLAGNTTTDQHGGWAGAEKLVNSNLWLTGRIGFRDADENGDAILARIDAEYRPNDALVLGAKADHDLYLVTPGAVSRDIEMTATALRATWHMNDRTSLNMDGGYTFLTDSNGFWTATLAPRYIFLSGGKFSVDLGLSGQYSSFSEDRNNGYYDPNSNRQFLASIFSSYAFDANNVINVTLSPGIGKDESLSHYKRAGDYSIEGNFGLYKDFMVSARADYYESGSNTKDYHRSEYTIGVTGRF